MDINFRIGTRYYLDRYLSVTDFLKFNEPYVTEYILGNTKAIESNGPNAGNLFRINTGEGHFLDIPFPLLGSLRQKYLNKDDSKELYRAVLIEPSEKVLQRIPFECPEVDLTFKRPQYEFEVPTVKKLNVIDESISAETEKAYYRGHDIEGIIYYAWTNIPWQYLLEFTEQDFGFCYEPQNHRFHAETFTDEQFKETVKDIAENGMIEEIRLQITSAGQINKALSARLRSLAAIALELETVPVCLIYRCPIISNCKYPTVSIKPSTTPINPEFIKILNKAFSPYVIFTGELTEDITRIPQNYIDYDNDLLFLNKKMIDDFPNKIYSLEDLKDDYFK